MKIIISLEKEKKESSYERIYKPSFYNILVKKYQNQCLVFNNLTNTLAIIEMDLFELLSQSKTIMLKEEKYTPHIKDLILMVEKGFLVPNSFDEVAYVEDYIYSKQKESDHAVIVIAPTTYCNMGCPYCFESGVVESTKMSKNTAEDTINYIKKNYSNKDLSVVWYGGEPLLCLDTIKTISQSLIDYTNSVGKEYAAGMITNASLLEPTVSDELKKANVQVLQVTLDGFEEAHNIRRSLKNGSKTFWKIISNLEYAKDLFKISLRINVDSENIEDALYLLEWLDHEKKHWENKVVPYVAPVTKVHDAMNYKNMIQRKDFGDLFKKYYMDYFVNRKDTNTSILKSSKEYFLDQCCALERKAWRGLFPFSLTNPCGTTSDNLITIDPEGKLYKCWDTVGVKDEIVGDIYTGLSNNSMCKTWNSYKLPSKCLECNYLPICLGGCKRESIVNKNPSCPQDFIYYKDVLEGYYENWRKTNSIEEDK